MGPFCLSIWKTEKKRIFINKNFPFYDKQCKVYYF